MAAPRLLRVIEARTLEIERLIDAVHAPVRGFMQRHPRLRSALDGTWLGHPLHPALVSLPIGAWMTGLMLDLAGMVGMPSARGAADLAYGVGIAGALGAIAPGLAEWSYLEGKARRVAFVHATVNLVATGLFGGSLLLRATGHRGAGILMAMAGIGLVGFGGWLGGELTFHEGAGVGRISSARGETEDEGGQRLED